MKSDAPSALHWQVCCASPSTAAVQAVRLRAPPCGCGLSPTINCRHLNSDYVTFISVLRGIQAATLSPPHLGPAPCTALLQRSSGWALLFLQVGPRRESYKEVGPVSASGACLPHRNQRGIIGSRGCIAKCEVSNQLRALQPSIPCRAGSSSCSSA